MANVINWFEIPVADLDRAERFYAEVLGARLAAAVAIEAGERAERAVLQNSAEHVAGAAARAFLFHACTPSNGGEKYLIRDSRRYSPS